MKNCSNHRFERTFRAILQVVQRVICVSYLCRLFIRHNFCNVLKQQVSLQQNSCPKTTNIWQNSGVIYSQMTLFVLAVVMVTIFSSKSNLSWIIRCCFDDYGLFCVVRLRTPFFILSCRSAVITAPFKRIYTPWTFSTNSRVTTANFDASYRVFVMERHKPVRNCIAGGKRSQLNFSISFTNKNPSSTAIPLNSSILAQG